jgi:hypothetical protein
MPGWQRPVPEQVTARSAILSLLPSKAPAIEHGIHREVGLKTVMTFLRTGSVTAGVLLLYFDQAAAWSRFKALRTCRRLQKAGSTPSNQFQTDAKTQELRNSGQYTPLRQIAQAADDYLATHREELIKEAKAIVERWQAEGFFGTAQERMICKGFRFANVMNKMETEDDCWIRSGQHRWTNPRCAASSLSGGGSGTRVRGEG